MRTFRHKLPILLVLCFSAVVSAGFEYDQISAKAAGMGSTSLALTGSADLITGNPSAIANIVSVSLSLFHTRLFGMRELSVQSVSCAVPTRFGNLGVFCQTFGFSLYRETTIATGWSHHYQNIIHFGILLRMAQLEIKNYGLDRAWPMDLGFIVPLTKKLSWGFSIVNIGRAKLGRQSESLPRTTGTGISWKIRSGWSIAAELVRDTRYPVEIRGGCEFAFSKTFFLRCGLTCNPSTLSFGAGISRGRFTIDYAVNSHPVLGFTHHTSLTINFKNGNDRQTTD